MDSINNIKVNTWLITALIGLLIWVAKKYMRKLDDHVKICNKRAVMAARHMQWIGDSVHAIAEKTGTRTAPRPRISMEGKDDDDESIY